MGDVLAFRDRERTPARPPDVAGMPPPHDLEAEAAVLSAMMLDPRAVPVVLALVGPEHCYSDANGRIVQAIKALHEAGTPVDLVTVRGWLDGRGWLERVGGVSYLATLADATPGTANVQHHAEIVRDRAEDRELIATCQRVAVEGYRIPGERAEWRARVRSELGRATAPRVKLHGATMRTGVSEARAHVHRVVSGEMVGVPWGLRAIDDGLALGLLARGRQHVIAGRSEMGKTALMMQVAIAIAGMAPDSLGVREAVYVLSLEMKRRDLVFRAACSCARVDASRVEMGLALPDELTRLARWLDYLDSLPIIIDDEAGTPQEVAARVARRKEDFERGRARDEMGNLLGACRMQVFAADHVQRWAQVASGADRRADVKQHIAAVSFGACERIAKGCDMATVLASQMRRDVEDASRRRDDAPRWPTKSDLAGATELEADADTIIAVHRPEVLDPDCSDEWRGVAAILRLKGRFGGTRKIARAGFNCGYFDDLPAHARGYERDEQ